MSELASCYSVRHLVEVGTIMLQSKRKREMCAPSTWVKSNGLRVEWTFFTSCVPRDNCACFGKQISPSIRARHNRIRFQLEQLWSVFTRADRFVMIESRENCAIAEKLEERKSWDVHLRIGEGEAVQEEILIRQLITVKCLVCRCCLLYDFVKHFRLWFTKSLSK